MAEKTVEQQLDDLRNELALTKKEFRDQLEQFRNLLRIVGDETGSSAGHFIRIQKEINNLLAGKRKT